MATGAVKQPLSSLMPLAGPGPSSSVDSFDPLSLVSESVLHNIDFHHDGVSCRLSVKIFII